MKRAILRGEEYVIPARLLSVCHSYVNSDPFSARKQFSALIAGNALLLFGVITDNMTDNYILKQKNLMKINEK